MSFVLSVCIPTYNRSKHLNNCLNSICDAIKGFENIVEICISDNGSNDDTHLIIEKYKNFISITHNRNISNLGIPKNFLKVVSMASGEYAWLIGDDDLVLPNTFKSILQVLNNNNDIDFLYANSSHLTTEYVMNYPQPFQIENLPLKLTPFSEFSTSGRLPFLKLIDPKISFDFLGGMFLAIFKREMWIENAHVLRQEALNDGRTFSYFDNTFPHVKIFAIAFSKSNAYFLADPVSVCLTGAREWSPMYPLIHSVRLVEAIEEFRQNGLPFFDYIKCRNFALNNFVSDVCAMIYYGEKAGLKYINPFKLFLKNIFYPNTYLSLFYFIGRKIKSLFK